MQIAEHMGQISLKLSNTCNAGIRAVHILNDVVGDYVFTTFNSTTTDHTVQLASQLGLVSCGRLQ